MSPSRHQSGEAGEYRCEAHKMLVEKDEETLLALVRGIRREERARRYLGEINRLGVEGEVKDGVVAKLGELQ